MKSFLFTISLFTIFPVLLFSQTPPDTLWTKTFGGLESEHARSVQNTADGGIIIAGYTLSYGNGLQDFYLIKTDSNGDTLWTNTYGGADSDLCYSLQQTTDGGYIMAGQTSSFGYGQQDVYLIKTDSNGDTLWTNTYGGIGQDFGFSVIETSDNGYCVTGYTDSYGLDDQLMIIKTNELGEQQWLKTYGESEEDKGYSIIQCENNLLVTGYLTIGGNTDVWLIKTDENGDSLWTKTFGGNGVDKGWCIVQANDSGFVITGDTNSFGSGPNEIYMVKTDPEGNYINSNNFGGLGSDFGRSICQTLDNGYIITGYSNSFGLGDNDLYLVKTDPEGNYVWSNSYGGSNDDTGWDVIQTTDEGFVITGSTNSFGSGNDDFWLIKLDKSDHLIEIPSEYTTIQEGINASADGDTVLVAPGTYVENINYNGKNITVGSWFLTTQDTSYISQTIIDGNSSGSVVTFENGEDSTAVLCGLTVTNGNAVYGGGIYCINSSPNIENVEIYSNESSVAGGGLYCEYSEAILNSVVIKNNTSTENAGGLYLKDCGLNITNTLFAGNHAYHRGGGIYYYTSPTYSGSESVIQNTTFFNNSVNLFVGGGMYSHNYSSIPEIINAIFWNNLPDEIFNSNGDIEITYSDIQDGWTGTGNIDEDPLFVDSTIGNFHLTDLSPCIDTGSPDPQYNDPDGTRADMGAYFFEQYFFAEFTATPTTGYLPLEVSFTNLSTGDPTSWQWDFDNDGSIDSYEQNPNYTYTFDDVYSVKLIVESLTEADTLIKTDYITAQYGPPQNLTATPTISDITLTWNKCYQPDILIYKIFRDVTPNPTTQIGATVHPDTNYVDLNVEMNTTYYYRVTGYTSLGEETDYSNEVSTQLLPQMNVNPNSFNYLVNSHTISDTIIDNIVIDNTGGGQLNYYITGSDTLEPNVDHGYCLMFDGENDYVDINVGSELMITDEISVETWVKPQALNNSNIIIKYRTSIYGDWWFDIDNLKWRAKTYGGTGEVYSLESIILDEWYHLVLLYDNTSLRFYVNGIFQGEDTSPGTISGNSYPLYFGGNASYYFNGQIDDVRIWNRILDETEIQDNLYTNLSGYESDLVGYWILDEGNGSITYDATTNGNNGTIYGAQWFDSTIPESSGSILSFNPSSGIIEAGSRLSQMISMNTDASGLEDGIYNISADIIHNDPNVTNPFIIPVTITVDRTPPEKVTGLTSSVTMTEVSLFWDPSVATDIDKYNIYRSVDPEENILLTSVNHPDTSFVDSSIPEEQLTYFYWITSEDIHENIGEYSDSISTYLDIPAPVQNLSIQIVNTDAVLTWDEVTETVYGNPIQDLTGYIVYFTEKIYNADTLFSFHAFTPIENYTHQYAALFADAMFYRITAYTGDLEILRDVIKKYPDLKLGELDILIEREKNKNQLHQERSRKRK